jgi:hypothetical protein
VSLVNWRPGQDIGAWHTHVLPGGAEMFSPADIDGFELMGLNQMYVGTYSGTVLTYDPSAEESMSGRKNGVKIASCPPFEGKTPVGP